MRDYILVYINGERITLFGDDAFIPLSTYLKSYKNQFGTRVVCSEGDCGACTVLCKKDNSTFKAINACIAPMASLDCAQIITVEGLNQKGALSHIQIMLAKYFGTQCGYCTPGFIMSLTQLFHEKKQVTEQHIKNALTGNLCRCTGYKDIVTSAQNIDAEKALNLDMLYDSDSMSVDIINHKQLSINITTETNSFYSPLHIHNACEYAEKNNCKIISACTDLGVTFNKHYQEANHFLSLSLSNELSELSEEREKISIGANITLTQLEQFLENRIPEFSKLLRVFASPQIKNNATLVGNIANASPIGDTIPYLLVAEAELEIQSTKGVRYLNINQFYLDYRKTALRKGEIITKILLKKPQKTTYLKLYKACNRKDLDISNVCAAFQMKCSNNTIDEIKIAYGGIDATVKRLFETEKFLSGKTLEKTTMKKATLLISNEISPLSDLRASKEYRLQLAENLFKQFYYDTTQGDMAC